MFDGCTLHVCRLQVCNPDDPLIAGHALGGVFGKDGLFDTWLVLHIHAYRH